MERVEEFHFFYVRDIYILTQSVEFTVNQDGFMKEKIIPPIGYYFF